VGFGVLGSGDVRIGDVAGADACGFAVAVAEHHVDLDRPVQPERRPSPGTGSLREDFAARVLQRGDDAHADCPSLRQ
jgi:hypothetical protein